jgi:hypothetical protein
MRRNALLFPAAVVLAIAASLLESMGISTDVTAGALAATVFGTYIAFRLFKMKRGLDIRDALLGIPVLFVCVLVLLKESGTIVLSSAFIWIAFGLLSVLAIGYAMPSDH